MAVQSVFTITNVSGNGTFATYTGSITSGAGLIVDVPIIVAGLTHTLFNGTFKITSITPTFILGRTFGAIRNDFTGTVGLLFTAPSSSPPLINALGRWVIGGNSLTHTLYLCIASPFSIVGSVTVNTVGAPPGEFLYGAITPFQTVASTNYALLSSETIGGDQWWDAGAVTFNSALGTVIDAEYSLTTPPAVLSVGAAGSSSYVPVSFQKSFSTVIFTTANINVQTPVSDSGTGTYDPEGVGVYPSDIAGGLGYGYTQRIVYPTLDPYGDFIPGTLAGTGQQIEV